MMDCREISQDELDTLLEERDRLRARAAELEARNAEWETFRAMFSDLSYHHQGMGCGIEDRGIHDRYQASEHGWDCAMERVAELIPEEVESTPAPDVVTVPREEWEAVNEFADMIVPLRDNLAGISWTGKLVDVFAAYDRWYAVRIHADQAPDALRSGEGGKERE